MWPLFSPRLCVGVKKAHVVLCPPDGRPTNTGGMSPLTLSLTEFWGVSPFLEFCGLQGFQSGALIKGQILRRGKFLPKTGPTVLPKSFYRQKALELGPFKIN